MRRRWRLPASRTTPRRCHCAHCRSALVLRNSTNLVNYPDVGSCSTLWVSCLGVWQGCLHTLSQAGSNWYRLRLDTCEQFVMCLRPSSQRLSAEIRKLLRRSMRCRTGGRGSTSRRLTT